MKKLTGLKGKTFKSDLRMKKIHKKTEKNIIICVIAALAVFTAACGGSADESSTSSQSVQIQGETIDTGTIIALCPDGWLNADVYDLEASDAETIREDSVRFIKNGSTNDDFLTNAYIEIRYYSSESAIEDFDANTVFDSAEKLDNITTGSIVWSGYSAVSMGRSLVYLKTEQKNVAYTACLYMGDGADNTAALSDADVQGILASVKKGNGKTV